MSKRKNRVRANKAHSKIKKSSIYGWFFILLFFIFIIFASIFYYFQFQLDKSEIDLNRSNQVIEENKQKITELQKLLGNSPDENSELYLSEIKDLESAIDETLYITKHNKTKAKIVYKKIKSQKPKLAIIIDDISFAYQVKAIKKLHLPVTLSFLPPTYIHPLSAKISKNIKYSMIHLPLQASNMINEEDNTLHIGDSISVIDSRIKRLRELYPNVVYMNNHTGSKYTADYQSMDRLYKVLDNYNFKFVDSRTTPDSKAIEIAQKYNKHLYSRDTFLDNELNEKYIHSQIKKAIKKAIKNGYSIAICHPHSITIKSLKSAKYLFKDIELVYLDKI